MIEQQKRGRLQLLLLAAVFFGPVLIAWLLYDPTGSRPAGDTTAHGELLTPVRLVPDANLRVAREDQDSPYPGRWTLVHTGEGACGETCRQALYETRQVRKALGKEDRRVQRILFLSSDAPLDPAVAGEHPSLLVFAADHALAHKFVTAAAPDDAGDIYLVDPLGNLIMRFPAGTGMKGIHRDLKKLLTISQIG